jgi:hypothetical protein
MAAPFEHGNDIGSLVHYRFNHVHKDSKPQDLGHSRKTLTHDGRSAEEMFDAVGIG